MSVKKPYESPLGEFPNEIERGVSSGEGPFIVGLTVLALVIGYAFFKAAGIL